MILCLPIFLLLALGIAACGVPPAATDTPPPVAVPDAPATPETPAVPDAPDANQEPEAVTLQILDWSDGSAAQRRDFHDLFMERHPHINIEYTQVTVDQFRTSVIVMIRAGDSPDIFPIPGGLTLSMALQEGWYQPMTPFLTDEFIATIDPNMLVEGRTTRNGVIYTLPEWRPVPTTLFFYNINVLEKAGVTELPETFSEFLEVSRHITEVGNGQFFAIIDGGVQLNRLNELARVLTTMGGGQIAHFAQALTVNGRAPYDSPEMIAGMQFIAQLVADGSFHPDTVSINAPEARELFAQDQAAFICQGLWCVGYWETHSPDLRFGVMAPPRPDDAPVSFLNHGLVTPWAGIARVSEIPEIAAKYLMALYSHDYGYQRDAIASGGFVSFIDGINEQYMAHPVGFRYFDLAHSLSVAIPVAVDMDEAVNDFFAEVIDVQPSLGAIVQGVLAGAIPDIEGELRGLADAATAEWQRAADAVGLDFSVFEFPNWVPGIPYAS